LIGGTPLVTPRDGRRASVEHKLKNNEEKDNIVAICMFDRIEPEFEERV
jgi:hypothetical protein